MSGLRVKVLQPGFEGDWTTSNQLKLKVGSGHFQVFLGQSLAEWLGQAAEGPACQVRPERGWQGLPVRGPPMHRV